MTVESDQDPQRAAQRLSYELLGVPDPPALFEAVCQLLPQLINCDEVVWDGGDVVYQWATMHDAGTDRYGPDVERLLLEVRDNPVRRHYLSGSDLSGRPVRIGDLTSDRQFRNTRAWAELFGPLGITRQLTIPTIVTARRQGDGTPIEVTGGVAWSLNRAGAEFSDHDLAVATALQPLLKTLETRTKWSPGPDDTTRIRMAGPYLEGSENRQAAAWKRSVPPMTPLTARELEVLALVARGLTATSIGLRLQISPTTVRKHLEHIYGKTGQRDRLLAVTYARQTGLLPET